MAIDCGIKQIDIRIVNKLGCKVTIVPYNTTSSEIEKLNPDGIFISNGPGDPQDVMVVVNTIRNLIGKYPIFGICFRTSNY